MRYTCIAIAALLFATPAIADETVYDLGTMKLASRQAFLMANSARVWAKATASKECMATAHEAMTRAADAALFTIQAIDSDDQEVEDRAIRNGRINANRSVKLSASCLQPNYKLPVQVVIPYGVHELEEVRP